MCDPLETRSGAVSGVLPALDVVDLDAGRHAGDDRQLGHALGLLFAGLLRLGEALGGEGAGVLEQLVEGVDRVDGAFGIAVHHREVEEHELVARDLVGAREFGEGARVIPLVEELEPAVEPVARFGFGGAGGGGAWAWLSCARNVES